MKSGKLSHKLGTMRWAFQLAWKIDPKPMLFWFGLGAVLAVLPAVALRFNRETLSVLSGFLSGEAYEYVDVVRPLVTLGILLTIIGLSNRVNVSLIYNMMYDTYYCGYIELIMESVQRIDMHDLLKKEVNDEYSYFYQRGGSLTDFMSGLCAILTKLITTISLLVVAYTMSEFVFFASLIYVIGTYVLNFTFLDKTRGYNNYWRHESRIAQYYERMSEHRGMARETRIYENTDEIVQHWAKPFGWVQKWEDKRIRASELRDFISSAGFYAFLIIVVGVNLYNVAGGSISPDVFLLLFTLCLNIYNSITGTVRNINTFDYGLYALERQYQFIKTLPAAPEEAELADTILDSQTVFAIENLSFSYMADKPVLKNINLEIKKGEIVALVGQNGSGKTTLVKLLLGMYRYTAGEIRFFGRPLRAYKKAFLRSKIGVFFQDFYVFHQTLRENVGFGSVEDIDNHARIQAAARCGGLEKIVARLSKGYETLLERNYDKTGVILSGGERQRVGVSRAFMNNREVLIFDEPASMLDPIAEMEQFQSIRDVLDGRTAILISHRVGFARMADRIVMMSDGRVVEMGSHDELMAKNGLYAQFFREQAQWYETAEKGAVQSG